MSSKLSATEVAVQGFYQGNYSFSTIPNPDGGDFKWAEERFQLKLDAEKEPFRLFIKTDAFFDHIDENADQTISGLPSKETSLEERNHRDSDNSTRMTVFMFR